jgi:hypothetical protein
VVRREQLVAAIRRIDASERELLWLSLRRRVPDAALARLYGCEQAEVARRRAAAIEDVADRLGVQRGEDFGSVLTGLMEAETWEAVAPELAAPAPPSPRPQETTRSEPPPPPAVEPEPAPIPAPQPFRESPVRARRLPPVTRWVVAGAIAAGLVITAAVVLASQGGGNHHRRGATFVPRPERGAAAPAPGAPCYFTASVARATELYRRPGGAPRVRIEARTRWGSPLVLHVVVRRAAWLGVIAPELGNGELAWLPTQAANVGCVAWSLQADLARGILEVRRGDRPVRTVRVAVGDRGRQVPTGRFAVTDRLQVNGRSPYGCCVLALSGHELSGRASGARLAVYAGGGGRAPAAGVFRASPDDARWLIDNVPLGTPVFIRR